MFELWGQLVDAICRPPRDDAYTTADLIGGENGKFRIAPSFNGCREDITLVSLAWHTMHGSYYTYHSHALALQTNKKGLKLVCSHFLPVDAKGKDGRLPCVIYCHCNSGSRRDAEEAVYILVPLGVSVFTLDFAGSGLSEGKFVTLGASEVDDVEVRIAAPAA